MRSKSRVTVSLTGARLKKTENGKVTLVDIPTGHVLYAPAETHAADGIGGSGPRTYIVEPKGRDWETSIG